MQTYCVAGLLLCRGRWASLTSAPRLIHNEDHGLLFRTRDGGATMSHSSATAYRTVDGGTDWSSVAHVDAVGDFHHPGLSPPARSRSQHSKTDQQMSFRNRW